MKDWRSQSHVKWDCKYHVVIVPKHRMRKFYGSLRAEIGKILHQLSRQKDIELVKGNALPDHVHLLLSVPPRYSIANTVGYLKGKSAIRINRDLGRVKGSLYGRTFWSRGYCVSTVGLDEAMIGEYIQDQKKTSATKNADCLISINTTNRAPFRGSLLKLSVLALTADQACL